MTRENAVAPIQASTPPHQDPASQQPWEFLSKVLCFSNPDHQLWWDALAPVFGSSMEITGYSIAAQYQHLLKVHAAIIPSLGPFPNNASRNITWPSAFGPGPLEASVNYQQNNTTLFRFTVEPTGPFAGTDADPLNDLAAGQLLQHLSHLQPGLDLSAFGALHPLLGIDGHEGRRHWDAIRALPNRSHTVVALDLQRDSSSSYNVKIYLPPLLRATMLGSEVISVMFDGLREYRATTGSAVDFSLVEEFMLENRAQIMTDKSYVSFDCKDPRRSRMKIYTEAIVTSLPELHRFWTLGGRLQDNAGSGPQTEKGFELVSMVWEALFRVPLPDGRRRESMHIQVNWELSPKQPAGAIVPKIYFTVIEDYDRDISEVVVRLFKDLGWMDHIETHKRIEQEAYPVCYSNSKSTSCYMWIALAYTAKSGPYVTVYTNPSADMLEAQLDS
ncbi:aromatic prenyltransferase [Aspergillus insuetus]